MAEMQRDATPQQPRQIGEYYHAWGLAEVSKSIEGILKFKEKTNQKTSKWKVTHLLLSKNPVAQKERNLHSLTYK